MLTCAPLQTCTVACAMAQSTCLSTSDTGELSSSRRSAVAVCMAREVLAGSPNSHRLPCSPLARINKTSRTDRNQDPPAESSLVACVTGAAVHDPSFTDSIKSLPSLVLGSRTLPLLLDLRQRCPVEVAFAASDATAASPAAGLWGSSGWSLGGPPCSQYCCSSQQLLGSSFHPNPQGGTPLGGLVATKGRCSLHTYSIDDARLCLTGRYGGNRRRAPLVVVLGDSMLRQLHLRMVAMARKQDHSLDVGQRRNHTRYLQHMDGSDTLQYGDPGDPSLIPGWLGVGSGGSGCQGHSRAAALESWFLWAPRFKDVQRTLQDLTAALNQGCIAGGLSEVGAEAARAAASTSRMARSEPCISCHSPVEARPGYADRDGGRELVASLSECGTLILVVGVWFWHTKHSWSDKESQREGKGMRAALQGAAVAGAAPRCGMSRLIVLNTPTGRMTRAELLPHVDAMRDRNVLLTSWVQKMNDEAGRGSDGGVSSVLLVDFDALSRSPAAPEGQIGMNWHYQCELRSSEDFAGAGAGGGLELSLHRWCLVPTPAGSCFDTMNAVLWQIIFNLLCNGR